MQQSKVIVVERKSQYGLLFQNRWYNFDKASNLSVNAFDQGKSYLITFNEYGGKLYITSSVLAGESSPPAGPTPPSMPATSVANTPPPGGAPPVAPAGSGNSALSVKDKSIISQSVVKAVVGGPALAHAIVGRSDDEAIELAKVWSDKLIDYIISKSV